MVLRTVPDAPPTSADYASATLPCLSRVVTPLCRFTFNGCQPAVVDVTVLDAIRVLPQVQLPLFGSPYAPDPACAPAPHLDPQFSSANAHACLTVYYLVWLHDSPVLDSDSRSTSSTYITFLD